MKITEHPKNSLYEQNSKCSRATKVLNAKFVSIVMHPINATQDLKIDLPFNSKNKDVDITIIANNISLSKMANDIRLCISYKNNENEQQTETYLLM